VSGGVLWVVKSTSILVTGYQPPVVLEVAVPLFGVGLVVLASGGSPDPRLTVARALGSLSVLAGLVALASELAGELWGWSLATASVAFLVGLLLTGAALRGSTTRDGVRGRVALTLALVTVPALLAGGALAEIDERLLELPLLTVACLWIWLGVLMLRSD